MERPEFANLTNYIFGSTAAIITNISLIVGLGSAQAGKGPIVGGLLTIAIADNISDSLGIHMYKEAEGHGTKLSLLATALDFVARLLVSLSFVGVGVAFPAPRSMVIATVWGLVLLTLISYLITKSRSQENPILEIVKHLVVAVGVLVGVTVGVRVAVGVSVLVGVRVAVGVSVLVGVRVGVGVRVCVGVVV